MNQRRLNSTVDRSGIVVVAGTRVRVLAVNASLLADLDPKERERVASMVGESFEAYEVDERGGAWVEKWWHESSNDSTSHSIGLISSEMEVVSDD